MIDISSTPILIIILLGSVGLGIPIIDAVKKEKGKRKNKLFSLITFATSLLIVSIMVSASSWNYMQGISNYSSYYSLILLSTIGMILIAYSTDFVMLFISWELMSIPTYALAAFSKKDPISNEAAIKYFMFGALSTSILVLGIGFVYAVTGTTNIGDSITILAELSGPNQAPDKLGGIIPISYLAIGLFVAGFGFKMGLVPFHMWLPDA